MHIKFVSFICLILLIILSFSGCVENNNSSVDDTKENTINALFGPTPIRIGDFNIKFNTRGTDYNDCALEKDHVKFWIRFTIVNEYGQENMCYYIYADGVETEEGNFYTALNPEKTRCLDPSDDTYHEFYFCIPEDSTPIKVHMKYDTKT